MKTTVSGCLKDWLKFRWTQVRLEWYNNIMARPYVTADDLINAGISERLDEVLEYAHKLRLAGADKAETLRHCEAYARKVLKI